MHELQVQRGGYARGRRRDQSERALPPAQADSAPRRGPHGAPPAAPTASIAAGPSSIESGACANLTWATANATDVTIDNGVGTVSASGSRQVCPTSTTTYGLTATGPGGTRNESASVTVKGKAAERPAPTDKLTIHVNFDTNKSEIRKADMPDMQKAEAFVKKYPNCKVEVDGYTDSTGSDAYNMALSQRRADAVKNWLVEHHDVAADKIETKGFGKSNPVADNKTAKGRAENRRAEILIFCQ